MQQNFNASEGQKKMFSDPATYKKTDQTFSHFCTNEGRKAARAANQQTKLDSPHQRGTDVSLTEQPATQHNRPAFPLSKRHPESVMPE